MITVFVIKSLLQARDRTCDNYSVISHLRLIAMLEHAGVFREGQGRIHDCKINLSVILRRSSTVVSGRVSAFSVILRWSSSIVSGRVSAFWQPCRLSPQADTWPDTWVDALPFTTLAPDIPNVWMTLRTY